MYSVVSEWEEACSGVQSETSEKAGQPSVLRRTAALGPASLTLPGQGKVTGWCCLAGEVFSSLRATPCLAWQGRSKVGAE